MSDRREDFKIDCGDTEICGSCEDPVEIAEAYKEAGVYYHPRCAGVWQCSGCGEWNEKAADICFGCGDPKPKARK